MTDWKRGDRCEVKHVLLWRPGTVTSVVDGVVGVLFKGVSGQTFRTEVRLDSENIRERQHEHANDDNA